MMDIKKRIFEILEKGHLMSLGTVDERGVWVADVIYIYDDDMKIYWMSDQDVRHSKAIEKNKNAAGSITVSNKSKEDNLGIQLMGIATKIEGNRHDLAVKHLTKRGYPAPGEDEDVLDGDSWYMLKPSKIDLIDEKNFGYDKKSLEL